MTGFNEFELGVETVQLGRFFVLQMQNLRRFVVQRPSSNSLNSVLGIIYDILTRSVCLN